MPNYVYISDDGDRKPIRLAAETASSGEFTQGATDDNDFVKVSKGSREFGQRPRGLNLSRNIGTAEVPNMRYKFLPVATIDAWNSVGIGTTLNVGSTTWTITGKVAEDN